MASVRNTVRIEVRRDAAKELRERFGLDWVCQRVIRDVCGFSTSEIFCLQDFSRAGFADVTLSSPRSCRDFYARCLENGGHEDLRGLVFKPLFGGEKVPLVVHMYNPYVDDEDVRIFLRRYCGEVSPGERLTNAYVIWTGRRRYTVKFGVSEAAPGGVTYPPGNFNIGPNRGFLWFPGQPVQCWKCGAAGHNKEQCMGVRCRNCGKDGHVAAGCGEPKACSLCGSVQHLYRLCPRRRDTYAGRVTGTAAGDSGDEETVGEQSAELDDSDEMEVLMARGARKRVLDWAEEEGSDSTPGTEEMPASKMALVSGEEEDGDCEEEEVFNSAEEEAEGGGECVSGSPGGGGGRGRSEMRRGRRVEQEEVEKEDLGGKRRDGLERKGAGTNQGT